MHLNYQTDYALRVLMLLVEEADRAANQTPVEAPRLLTIREIAEFHDISRNHLMKVVNALVDHGFVHAQRGRNGGLRLGPNGANVRVGDVVRAMEGSWRLVECFDAGSGKNQCRLKGHCRLQGALGQALKAFLEHLDRYTLADIAGTEQKVVLFTPR